MRKILTILFLLVVVEVSAQFEAVTYVDSTELTTDKLRNIDAFSKGLDAKINEDFAKAQMYFERALEYDSVDDGAMYELCNVYIQQNDIPSAYEMIKKAHEMKPDNQWYALQLAHFEKSLRNYDKVISIYDDLLKKEPTNVNYLQEYVDLLLELEKYNEAIDKLNVLEQELGASEFLSLTKIEIYQQINDVENLLKEAESLTQLQPFNTHYLSVLAASYDKYDKPEKALETYLRLRDIDPNDKYVHVSLLECYLKVGQKEKAKEEFILAMQNPNLDYKTKANVYDFWFEKEKDEELALQVGHILINVHPNESLGYFIVGSVLCTKSEWKPAEEMLLQSYQRDSTAFGTLYYLTFAENVLNNTKKTRYFAEKGIRYYPLIDFFYQQKGFADFADKKYQDAISAFEKANSRATEEKYTLYNYIYMGDAYHVLNDKANAYKCYDIALSIDPENIYVMNNYAYYLACENTELEKALTMSEKTIKEEPKNPIYLDTYAWVLYKNGRYKEAEKTMKQVFKYDKKPSGVNYEHYGDILFKLGKTQKAVENWKKAKSFDDGSELLNKKIKDQTLYE